MGFFTNKVKSVIKQKIASNLISGFQNAAFGQPKKLAAKLASKSPLDMSQSPVAHMGQVANPYNYGVATYPQETTNLGDGHYIIFDVIENKRTWLVLELEDEDGYLEKLSFPMENKHSQIRIGSNIRCLLTSNNRNFERDFYLTDAWLPEINLWVGEYPYLLRPAFEEICYIYLNR